MEHILAPVSAGELYDKITILQIKAERISDPDKLRNVRTELDLLTGIAKAIPAGDSAQLARLVEDLKRVNIAIWEAEDVVRMHERSGQFGPEFVATARTTYGNNDRRAGLKRQINVLMNSTLVEEKSHAGAKR